MADPVVIRERLFTKETVPGPGRGPGRGALERVLQRYKALLDLIRTRNEMSEASIEHVTDEQISQARDDLRRDVMLHQLEMKKLVLIERATDRDMTNCERSAEDLGVSLSTLREELTELKEKLASERLIRSRREEYETLSKAANNSTVPRKETNLKLVEIKSKLQDLRTQEVETTETLDLRQKQFHLLLQSIHDLQAQFSNEESKSNKKLRSDTSKNSSNIDEINTDNNDIEMTDSQSQNICADNDVSEGEIDASMEEGETV